MVYVCSQMAAHLHARLYVSRWDNKLPCLHVQMPARYVCADARAALNYCVMVQMVALYAVQIAACAVTVACTIILCCCKA